MWVLKVSSRGQIWGYKLNTPHIHADVELQLRLKFYIAVNVILGVIWCTGKFLQFKIFKTLLRRLQLEAFHDMQLVTP